MQLAEARHVRVRSGAADPPAWATSLGHQPGPPAWAAGLRVPGLEAGPRRYYLSRRPSV